MFDTNSVKSCPLCYATNLVGGKWSTLIMWHLSTSRVKRYGALKRSIPFNMSHKIFSQQLKRLEDNGLISRQEYDEVPPRVEYSLTKKGRELMPIIYVLRDWGAKWSDYPHETINKSTGVRLLMPANRVAGDPLRYPPTHHVIEMHEIERRCEHCA